MQSDYFNLLKQWCDSLLELQLNEIKSPGIYGGIMCPACSRIHGRCSDVVYPFMYMAHKTGEQRYLDAAIKLQNWSEHMSSPDGSWVNEPENLWKPITVFGVISLGEAIRHHGMLLEKEVYDLWKLRLRKAAAYVFETFTMDTGNINYPVTASAALTVAGIVLENHAYLEKGREFAHNSLKYFSQNKLLFGEGRPQNGYSPKGCRAIDLGYNVEESLPALVLYGLLTKDEEVLQTVTASLQEHLEFMLPDGAWDNSWGSRDFKWTYWGSRTSDGCQPAYALMADRDPRFAEAAWRNAELLKACTYDGVLYGGPHYHIKGELPCIHHTFGHAKALAAVLDFSDSNTEMQHTILPREKAQGIREYPEISTWLAALGPWRATVTAYDWEYMKDGHPSGGSISMLWHKELGPVLTGSLTEYAMTEPTNMQRVKDSLNFSLTPRLEFFQDEKYYRSISYKNANVTYKAIDNEIWIQSEGRLVDGDQKNPTSGAVDFIIKYIFTPNSFEILIKGDFKTLKSEIRFYLPIISDRKEEIYQSTADTVIINKNNQKLNINSSSHIKLIKCDNNRIFNHVPGFQAIPFYIRIEEGSSIKMTLK